MTVDAETLRALATAATPGPYVQWAGHAEVHCGPVSENLPHVIGGGRGTLLTIDEDGAIERAESALGVDLSVDDDDDADIYDAADTQKNADAAYFAALSPDVVVQTLGVLEAARAWAAVETTPPHPSSTGVADWAERREAARAALLAAIEAAS